MCNFWFYSDHSSVELKSILYILVLFYVPMIKAQNFTTDTLNRILDYDKNISGMNNQSHSDNNEEDEIIPLWRLFLDYRYVFLKFLHRGCN